MSNLRNQCRKPEGWVGRFVLWEMNRHHSKLTDWGLSHVTIGAHATILDVGCGGGRTVNKLARIASNGNVYGIDFSETSVAAAKKENRRWIQTGRVEIQHGSVSQLPFVDDTFDLVTAVETHFFWPDLDGDMRKILRVLKPGGVLVIIAEVYKGGKTMAGRLAEKYVKVSGMKLLTPDEHRQLFENAGYSDVQVDTDEAKGWIWAIGKKPQSKSF
jgi:SAM-dependent methyltransferase